MDRDVVNGRAYKSRPYIITAHIHVKTQIAHFNKNPTIGVGARFISPSVPMLAVTNLLDSLLFDHSYIGHL
jgi:hypothetical protein